MSAIWSHSFYLLVFSPLFLLSLFFLTILSDWFAQVINMLRFVLMLDWIRSQILFKVCLTSDNIFNSRTFHSNNFFVHDTKDLFKYRMLHMLMKTSSLTVTMFVILNWQLDSTIVGDLNSEKNNVTFVYHVIK